MRQTKENNGKQAGGNKLHYLAATLVLVAARAMAQQQQAVGDETIPVAEPEPERRIVVSILDRKLAVIEAGEVVKVYPVAVGAVVSASPTGEFKIVNRVTNPGYYHAGKVIAPGKSNPLGNRWMGLSKKGYGIHGTNEPRSIGKAASHGCIRMAKADLEELFNWARVGDVVEIRGERNTDVAQIFGGEPDAQETTAASNGLAGQN